MLSQPKYNTDYLFLANTYISNTIYTHETNANEPPAIPTRSNESKQKYMLNVFFFFPMLTSFFQACYAKSRCLRALGRLRHPGYVPQFTVTSPGFPR